MAFCHKAVCCFWEMNEILFRIYNYIGLDKGKDIINYMLKYTIRGTTVVHFWSLTKLGIRIRFSNPDSDSHITGIAYPTECLNVSTAWVFPHWISFGINYSIVHMTQAIMYSANNYMSITLTYQGSDISQGHPYVILFPTWSRF